MAATILSKVCFKCDRELPFGEFYKHPRMADGRLNKCKDCTKRDVRENRKARLDYHQEYDRQRANLPKRIIARRHYQQTDRGRERARAARQAWASRNPEKRAAHVALGNAVRDSRVIKPKSCPRCGRTGRIEGHHHDYSQPLVVDWLCPRCHIETHETHQ